MVGCLQTITGIMRRGDAEEAIRKYPIGVIPLGHSNQFAKRLMRYKDDTPDPQFIAESAMAVVRHKMKLQDLMEITIIEDPLVKVHLRQFVG
jgi:diacylglycerol kinase family enzyme